MPSTVTLTIPRGYRTVSVATDQITTKSKRALTRAARQYRGRQFEVSDIELEVDRDKWMVRRALNKFADLGYLKKCETKNSPANNYCS